MKGYVKELKLLYFNELFISFYFPKAIIILFYLSRNLSITELGLVSAVGYAANMILEYPSGIFADKFGRKLSLQIANLGAVTSMIIWGFSNSIIMVLIASAFWGASWSFYSGSREALIYDSLLKNKKEKLNKNVLGFIDAIGYCAVIIATITGQFLFNINYSYPFFASAILYFIGFIIFSFFKEPEKHKSAETLDIKKAFKEGIQLIFRNKTLLSLFILSVSIFFFEHAWYEVNQKLLLDSGFPQNLLSTYFVISSILGLIYGIILPKIIHKLKTIKTTYLVIILQSLSLFSISTGNYLILAPFSYILMLSHTLWNYNDADIVHKHIPSKIRATAMSGRQLMLSAIFLFNPWLMTFLVDKFRWAVFVYEG